MGRLLLYVRPYRNWMIFATVLLFAAAILSNMVPVMTMLVIDDAIGNPDRLALREALDEAGSMASPTLLAEYEAAVDADRRALLRLIFIMFGLIVGEALIRYAQLFIVAVVGQKTMLEMRMAIFEHLQKMSLGFLDRHPVGRLMTRVTNDVEKIQATIVTGMVQVISDLFTVVIVLIFMLVINWKLALVTLAVIPLVFVISAVFRKFAHRAYLDIRKKIAVVNANMQENVSGMQVVQAFGQEDRQFEGFARLNADHRDEWLRQVRYYATYFPAIDVCGDLAFAAILLYGGHQILAGDTIAFGTASIGMFFAYMQFADRLFQPIMAIADRYNLLLEAMASSERIFDLLDTKPEVVDKPDAKRADSVEGAVEFRDVAFAYQDDEWVLKNINLVVKPGERVAIVGHTGAGKTTLSALLSRFYDVQQGQVLIDGIDVRDYDQISLRRQIGVVLQDVFLFSGTIEDNIRLGDPDMDRDWIRACAEYVNAARFIEKHNDGYDYDVGERGCNLSTGQRQLLAFARTLAHNPRILVLDEATSSVDTETESLIQDAIHKLMEDRTSIVIAHRLSTVQNADRIVVMHHGEIHEVGTHQELLAQRGIYYRLYQLQYKDQASAA
jgi:ATP-binding cassette, subfamily B, multidrug efflux pump